MGFGEESAPMKCSQGALIVVTNIRRDPTREATSRQFVKARIDHWSRESVTATLGGDSVGETPTVRSVIKPDESHRSSPPLNDEQ